MPRRRELHPHPAHPARGALIGAALGLLAALLANAPEPDLVVLSGAATGAIVADRIAGKAAESEPLAPALLAIVLVAFGIHELTRNAVLGALALMVGALLIGAGLRVWLARRRLRRIASRRSGRHGENVGR